MINIVSKIQYCHQVLSQSTQFRPPEQPARTLPCRVTSTSSYWQQVNHWNQHTHQAFIHWHLAPENHTSVLPLCHQSEMSLPEQGSLYQKAVLLGCLLLYGAGLIFRLAAISSILLLALVYQPHNRPISHQLQDMPESLAEAILNDQKYHQFIIDTPRDNYYINGVLITHESSGHRPLLEESIPLKIIESLYLFSDKNEDLTKRLCERLHQGLYADAFYAIQEKLLTEIKPSLLNEPNASNITLINAKDKSIKLYKKEVGAPSSNSEVVHDIFVEACFSSPIYYWDVNTDIPDNFLPKVYDCSMEIPLFRVSNGENKKIDDLHNQPDSAVARVHYPPDLPEDLLNQAINASFIFCDNIEETSAH